MLYKCWLQREATTTTARLTEKCKERSKEVVHMMGVFETKDQRPRNKSKKK